LRAGCSRIDSGNPGAGGWGAPASGLLQSDHSLVVACLPMPIRTPRPQSSPAWVVKLQILAAVFVPMLALSLWLRSQGFW
jgi:hypothetical protein